MSNLPFFSKKKPTKGRLLKGGNIIHQNNRNNAENNDDSEMIIFRLIEFFLSLRAYLVRNRLINPNNKQLRVTDLSLHSNYLT